MAGAGTGYPDNFVCHVARRTQTYDPELGRTSARMGYRYPEGHDVVRTGRTRRAPSRGKGHPRKLHESHEYRCACGHVGWSCLVGVLGTPLAEDAAA